MGARAEKKRGWAKDRGGVPQLDGRVRRVITLQVPVVIYQKFLREQAIAIEATGGKGKGKDINPFVSDSTMALFLLNTALDAMASQREEFTIREAVAVAAGMSIAKPWKDDEEKQIHLPMSDIPEHGTPEGSP